MEAKTFVRCYKCGETAEYGEATKLGWLVASRKNGRGMVIRCPAHITRYAIKQSKKR